jgi:hypothetical protein
LLARHGEYFIGGIATREGRPTVMGARLGDKLVQIGTPQTHGASWEAIFAAMHGKAGGDSLAGARTTGKTHPTSGSGYHILVDEGRPSGLTPGERGIGSRCHLTNRFGVEVLRFPFVRLAATLRHLDQY